MKKKRGKVKLWKEIRNQMLVRDDFKCIFCGMRDKEIYLDKKGKKKTIHINACHILPKEAKLFRHLQYDIRNLVSGCSTCHKFGVFSFHKNPLYAMEIIKKKYPANYKFLLKEVTRIHNEKK